MATGLNQPTALVIDKNSGDLLVADEIGISTVAATALETGLAAQAFPSSSTLQPTQNFSTPGANGIVVDACTGDVYISDSAAGVVRRFDTDTEELEDLFTGLQQPGQLLGLFRRGVSCPDAFQMLVAETGADQLTLLTPSRQLRTAWVAALDPIDVSFLPGGTDFASTSAVLLTESVAGATQQGGSGTQSSFVGVPGLYNTDPINPPSQPSTQPASSARVDGTIIIEQLLSMTCNDPLNSTWEERSFNEFQFSGLLPLNGSGIINGLWVDDNGESRVGTGLFAGVGSEADVDSGTFDVVILQTQTPTSPTDLSGTWTVTLQDFEDDEGEELTLELSVTQAGNVFSTLIPDDFESDFFNETGCTVSCSAPGVCTAQCPNSVTCDMTCDPATPTGCQANLPFIGSVTETGSQPSVSAFDDANLEAAVREALGIGPTDPLTVALVQTLTSLDASSRNIQSLSGIESLSNLTLLSLEQNPISEIGPLSELSQLTLLVLIDNSVSDITPLAGLTQLRFLALEQNPVSDISPLAGLTQLTLLGLVDDAISDLTPLAGLTQLKGLSLHDNSISDLTPLSGLTQLRELELQVNSISDISPLVGLTQLMDLNLRVNSISDISPLAGLTQLTTLTLGNNSISDISPLSGLTQLTTLRIGGNSISDITPLSGLTQLTILRLIANSIGDITPLVANPGLGLGDTIILNSNLLDTGDCVDLQTLIDRGANVLHDVICP